jgi:hypothetical protein
VYQSASTRKTTASSASAKTTRNVAEEMREQAGVHDRGLGVAHRDFVDQTVGTEQAELTAGPA